MTVIRPVIRPLIRAATKAPTQRRGGAPSSIDADAAAWAAGVTANGGTYSAATLAAQSTLATALKAAGLWSKINRINTFCGDQLAAALVPLKVGGGNATDTNVNFVGGDYTEATGLTGNGSTKRLDTGLLASALTLSSTHFSIYNRSAAVGGAAISGSSDGTNFFGLAPPTVDGTVLSYQGNLPGALIISAVITTPYGHLVGTRTDASTHVVYRNGSSLASNAGAASALPAQSITLFSRNAAGTPTDFAAQIYAGYSIGSGLTAGDALAFSAHMEAFQDALGRGVM